MKSGLDYSLVGRWLFTFIAYHVSDTSSRTKLAWLHIQATTSAGNVRWRERCEGGRREEDLTCSSTCWSGSSSQPFTAGFLKKGGATCGLLSPWWGEWAERCPSQFVVCFFLFVVLISYTKAARCQQKYLVELCGKNIPSSSPSSQLKNHCYIHWYFNHASCIHLHPTQPTPPPTRKLTNRPITKRWMSAYMSIDG